MADRLNEYDYVMSLSIGAKDYPFYALIAAAMRQADTDNLEKLSAAFPGMYESLLEWRERPMWAIG